MRVFAVLAFAISIATPALAQAPNFPKRDAFEPGSGKVWFSGCVFEADRYVTCKSAAPGVLEAIADPGDQPAGLALQTYVSDVFIEKGCAFEAAPDSFRVNGVFLSFDSSSAKDIRCKGKAAKLEFSPDGMALSDTLFFYFDGPAQ